MKVFKTYMILLLSAVSLTVAGQGMSYNHDQMIQDQFMVAEFGAGTLGSAGFFADKYYEYTHRNYKDWASQRIHSKIYSREAVHLKVTEEEKYAESIQDSLVKRAEIEALNVADRELDVEWSVEKSKIQAQQAVFARSIQDIVYYGGTQEDKENWQAIYNLVQQSLDATHDAYMPNAQRKSMYILLYSDLCKYNVELNKLKMKWAAARAVKNQSVSNVTFNKFRDKAYDALGRWKLSWGGHRGSGSGGNGINVGD